jgi:diketogulonate reductase-like aldo/keto reductase
MQELPSIGFGTYKLKSQEEFNTSLDAVFKYKNNRQVMIDTAELYRNQSYIGTYLQNNPQIKRDEYWITSKISFHTMRKKEEDMIKSINKSLEDLKVVYIDLYLLHASTEDNITPWKILRQFQKDGKIKNIGVSNFNVINLTKFIKEINEIHPDESKYIFANQLEYNPFLNRTELINLCHDHNIKVIGYGSFYKMNDDITRIAEEINKTSYQLILKWMLQNKVNIIPMSRDPKHIYDNMNLDFELNKDHMYRLDCMNDGSSKYERYL